YSCECMTVEAEEQHSPRPREHLGSLGNQRVMSWCGPLYVIGIFIGFWLIAGLIPPPHASDSAQQVAHLYRSDTTTIRIGLFITITATSLLAPFTAAIAVQMLRIESRKA